MKKLSLISYFLVIFSIFVIGSTNNGSLDSKDIKNQILTLNVSSSSEKNLIATEDNSGIKYPILN